MFQVTLNNGETRKVSLTRRTLTRLKCALSGLCAEIVNAYPVRVSFSDKPIAFDSETNVLTVPLKPNDSLILTTASPFNLSLEFETTARESQHEGHRLISLTVVYRNNSKFAFTFEFNPTRDCELIQ